MLTMNDTSRLHHQLESLEERLSKMRRELDTLGPAHREGLGKLLETISESLSAHEETLRG